LTDLEIILHNNQGNTLSGKQDSITATTVLRYSRAILQSADKPSMYPKDHYARTYSLSSGNSITHDQDTRSRGQDTLQNPYVVTITTIMGIMMSDKSISKEDSKKYITLLRQKLDTWEKQTSTLPEKRKGDDKPEAPKKKKKPIDPLRNVL